MLRSSQRQWEMFKVTFSTSNEKRSASNINSHILSAPTVLSTTPPYKYSNKRRNITGDVSGIVIFLKEMPKLEVI